MVIEYGLWYYIVLVDSRVGRGRAVGRAPMTRVASSWASLI